MSPAAAPDTADIVVVGAGVMGCSIALQLTRRGAGRVVILDQRHAGEGMSSRSSALVRMHYTFRPEVELAVLGRRLYESWPDLVGAPSLLTHTGFVRFVEPEETERLRCNVAMQRACGAEVELVEGDRLKELLPGWRVEDVALAAHEPQGKYGDGARAAGDMLARARELGADYRPQLPVTAVRRRGDRVEGVDTTRGPIRSPLVVLAIGPWTPRLLRPLGVEVPIETELHLVAVVRTAEAAAAARVACIDSCTQTYFRPDGGAQWLVGEFRGPRGPNPDDFPQHPAMDALGELVGRAARRLPALGDGGLARGYTGVYDMTPDGRAVLGPIDTIPGLFVACGFSGTGFKLAPAIGVVMAEWILDGRAVSVDVSAFGPDRFARGALIRSPQAYRDE